MPKQKSHKSLLARLEISGAKGKGKLRMRKMSVTHRARFKSKRALRQSAHKLTLSPGQAKKLKKALV